VEEERALAGGRTVAQDASSAARPARWPWLGFVAFFTIAVVGMVGVSVNGEPLSQQVPYVIAFSMFGIVGALIVSRDRRNVIGFMLMWASLFTALSFTTGELATWAITRGDGGPLVVTAALTNNIGWVLGILPVLFLLPLLFPDGRLPSPRWRPYLWFVIAFLVFVGLDLLFGQRRLSPTDGVSLANPLFLEPLGQLPSIDPVIGVLYPGLLLTSVISLFLRFRRSAGVERQQIKWAAFGFTAALVGVTASDFVRAPILSAVIGGAAFLAFPLSIAIAVLRFRLYDLDVVVKKAVVYAALAVFATVVYAALVVGLGAWLGQGDSFLTMLAAVIVAVTFQPVRARLTRLANRLVYGRRATPYELLTAFSDRLGDAYAEIDVLPRMARVLGEGVGADRSEVWLSVEDELRRVASWPQDEGFAPPVQVNGEPLRIPGTDRAYAVEHAGTVLGALAVRKPASEPISPADEKLIAGLASQAGLVMRNVRLNEELKLRLVDLRAAQKRLVAAQDAERRRLERNIHDGAQQQLVALAVKSRLARQLTERDPVKAAVMLEQIETETQQALEDLRDLARGIYPPLLADKGLPDALAAQARKSPVPTQVSATDVDRYPQEVEAAVYFSVLEALQNVAKYAEASHAEVRIRQDGAMLTFEVRDDGHGFDPATVGFGTGLQGMADRLAVVDGALDVESRPGSGTTVRGRLPVPAVVGP
jgi:signal transduction histidine kinase